MLKKYFKLFFYSLICSCSHMYNKMFNINISRNAEYIEVYYATTLDDFFCCNHCKIYIQFSMIIMEIVSISVSYIMTECKLFLKQ